MEVRYVECAVAAPASRLPGLDRAINPYRGCTHSCAYCYAQDVTRFETDRLWGDVVEAKVNIARRLKRELSRGTKGVYGVGTVTDPYQPLEKKLELTRSCLSLLRRFDADTSILTKSDLVVRDMDLMADWSGLEVGMSVACADDAVAAIVEPRSTAPTERFKALGQLSAEGVEVYLMAAPIIPHLSDSKEQMELLVSSARASGVQRIMWDMWNPKPIATRRLRAALNSAGLDVPSDIAAAAKATGDHLARACSDAGIQLVSAF